jgi:hypothetical protein
MMSVFLFIPLLIAVILQLMEVFFNEEENRKFKKY